MTTNHTYTAPSGITVTSVNPQAEPDFPNTFSYLKWSYSSWGRKILRAYGFEVKKRR